MSESMRTRFYATTATLSSIYISSRLKNTIKGGIPRRVCTARRHGAVRDRIKEIQGHTIYIIAINLEVPCCYSDSQGKRHGRSRVEELLPFDSGL